MYEQDDAIYDSRRPIAPHEHTRPTTERDWIKRTLIGLAIAFMLAVIILPLVFGHLGMQHLIQGVFDITSAGHSVVGTNLINESGTSVEFVAQRWNMLVAGVAVWRLYDVALLALTVIHGFNGLRYVLTDYHMQSTWLRRASIYLCVIASVILLVVGGLAILSTIDSSAIEIARNAAETLHSE